MLVVFSQVLQSSVYSSGQRPCKFHELHAVVEFYFVETMFIFGINFHVALSKTPRSVWFASYPSSKRPPV